MRNWLQRYTIVVIHSIYLTLEPTHYVQQFSSVSSTLTSVFIVLRFSNISRSLKSSTLIGRTIVFKYHSKSLQGLNISTQSIFSMLVYLKWLLMQNMSRKEMLFFILLHDHSIRFFLYNTIFMRNYFIFNVIVKLLDLVRLEFLKSISLYKNFVLECLWRKISTNFEGNHCLVTYSGIFLWNFSLLATKWQD